MLVPNQLIEAKWVPTSRQWYEDKGYEFTGYRKSFYVKAEDLPLKSHKRVKVQCDFCGEIIEKEFHSYYRSHEKSNLDCCSKCINQKISITIEEIYGCAAYFQTDDFKNKSRNTCIKKYGVEYAGQLESARAKMEETNLKKYGCRHPMNNEEIQNKVKNTCMERYGVENPFQSKEIQGKIAQINIERYGAPIATQNPEIYEKIRKTLHENGNTPTSKAELEMFEIVKGIYGEDNCKHNYPYGKCSLDCYLEYNGMKFDIEYDGWYWHKDRQEKDKRRNYWLANEGFKTLRFRANIAIPTAEQIKDGIDYLIQTGHPWHYINLDI